MPRTATTRLRAFKSACGNRFGLIQWRRRGGAANGCSVSNPDCREKGVRWHDQASPRPCRPRCLSPTFGYTDQLLGWSGVALQLVRIAPRSLNTVALCWRQAEWEGQGRGTSHRCARMYTNIQQLIPQLEPSSQSRRSGTMLTAGQAISRRVNLIYVMLAVVNLKVALIFQRIDS